MLQRLPALGEGLHEALTHRLSEEDGTVAAGLRVQHIAQAEPWQALIFLFVPQHYRHHLVARHHVERLLDLFQWHMEIGDPEHQAAILTQVLRHLHDAGTARVHTLMPAQAVDDIKRVVHVMAERQRQLRYHFIIVSNEAEHVAMLERGIGHTGRDFSRLVQLALTAAELHGAGQVAKRKDGRGVVLVEQLDLHLLIRIAQGLADVHASGVGIV